MRSLLLIGAVDKRGVSYPVLKVMMTLGRVLVLTDDAMYRRFDEDYGMDFGFENSHFIIQPQITQDFVDSIKHITDMFDYVVYITTNEVIKADKTLYLRGINRAILGNDAMEELEAVEHAEVFVTYAKLANPKLLKIAPTKSQIEYFNECEDSKEFLATKDLTYVGLLATLFDKELGLPKKALKKIMLRKG